ncbi:hypothetical protein A5M85_05915 [Cellulophaga lytica]|nr:hypothetical protein A5M85_05915 [Cellulophaga lytica]
MPKLIFRNYNNDAIKSILKAIGKVQYEKALFIKGIEDKPKKLKNFYLESNLNTLHLCYRYEYPKKLNIKIMKLENNNYIPVKEWIIIK